MSTGAKEDTPSSNSPPNKDAESKTSTTTSTTTTTTKTTSTTTTTESGKKSDLPIEPHPHDVLFGRGGTSNNHHGNEVFRQVIFQNKPAYLGCEKHQKNVISKAIVSAIHSRDPPGRFLDRAGPSINGANRQGEWYEVEYDRAVEKVSQALRERKSKKRKKPEDSEQTKKKAASGPDVDVTNKNDSAGKKAVTCKTNQPPQNQVVELLSLVTKDAQSSQPAHPRPFDPKVPRHVDVQDPRVLQPNIGTKMKNLTLRFPPPVLNAREILGYPRPTNLANPTLNNNASIRQSVSATIRTATKAVSAKNSQSCVTATKLVNAVSGSSCPAATQLVNAVSYSSCTTIPPKLLPTVSFQKALPPRQTPMSCDHDMPCKPTLLREVSQSLTLRQVSQCLSHEHWRLVPSVSKDSAMALHPYGTISSLPSFLPLLGQNSNYAAVSSTNPYTSTLHAHTVPKFLGSSPLTGIGRHSRYNKPRRPLLSRRAPHPVQLLSEKQEPPQPLTYEVSYVLSRCNP